MYAALGVVVRARRPRVRHVHGQPVGHGARSRSCSSRMAASMFGAFELGAAGGAAAAPVVGRRQGLRRRVPDGPGRRHHRRALHRPGAGVGAGLRRHDALGRRSAARCCSPTRSAWASCSSSSPRFAVALPKSGALDGGGEEHLRRRHARRRALLPAQRRRRRSRDYGAPDAALARDATGARGRRRRARRASTCRSTHGAAAKLRKAAGRGAHRRRPVRRDRLGCSTPKADAARADWRGPTARAGHGGGQSAHKPALLDFYADWCLPCKELELKTFEHAEVAARAAALHAGQGGLHQRRGSGGQPRRQEPLRRADAADGGAARLATARSPRSSTAGQRRGAASRA